MHVRVVVKAGHNPKIKQPHPTPAARLILGCFQFSFHVMSTLISELSRVLMELHCRTSYMHVKIKHISAKSSALSQSPSQLLARMRRCIRVSYNTVLYLRGSRNSLVTNFTLVITPSAAGRDRECIHVKLVTKVLSGLACTSREALRFLLSQ